MQTHSDRPQLYLQPGVTWAGLASPTVFFHKSTIIHGLGHCRPSSLGSQPPKDEGQLPTAFNCDKILRLTRISTTLAIEIPSILPNNQAFLDISQQPGHDANPDSAT